MISVDVALNVSWNSDKISCVSCHFLSVWTSFFRIPQKICTYYHLFFFFEKFWFCSFFVAQVAGSREMVCCLLLEIFFGVFFFFFCLKWRHHVSWKMRSSTVLSLPCKLHKFLEVWNKCKHLMIPSQTKLKHMKKKNQLLAKKYWLECTQELCIHDNLREHLLVYNTLLE